MQNLLQMTTSHLNRILLTTINNKVFFFNFTHYLNVFRNPFSFWWVYYVEFPVSIHYKVLKVWARFLRGDWAGRNTSLDILWILSWTVWSHCLLLNYCVSHWSNLWEGRKLITGTGSWSKRLQHRKLGRLRPLSYCKSGESM